MVLVGPAIPSETVELDPVEVSGEPIGRITVVTMTKIPSIADTTAGPRPSAGTEGARVCR
ncbi:hypothetical protein SGRIM128S_02144 [Streptomyces griseomycini]